MKRVVGESLQVDADIFSDGHEIINAAILSRVVGETAWRRDPMVFVDNDRWSGHFPLERNARYEFTIEGWRDSFSSWVRDTRGGPSSRAAPTGRWPAPRPSRTRRRRPGRSW